MTNTTTAAPYPQTFNTFRAVGALRSFRPGIDMDGGDLDPRVIYSESLATLWQRADFIEAVNSGGKPAAVPGAMRLLSDFLREQTHLGTSMPSGGGHIIRALTAHRLVLKGVARRLWRGAQRDHGMPVRSMTASVGRPLPVIPSLPPLRQASPSGHSGRHG